MELRDIFVKGSYFPLSDHEDRIEKYRRNAKLAQGDHHDIFKENAQKNEMYISANFAGLITRKSADFLFGEKPLFSSGKKDKSKEQKALDRIVKTNKFERLCYQLALQAATYGDAFVKIRYGQEYAGAFPEVFDKKRLIVEAVDPKKVYPQVHPLDNTKIVAYHIAEPVRVTEDDDKFVLHTESHYAGKIVYRQFEMNVIIMERDGTIKQYKIGDEIPSGYSEVATGVPVPLVVHIPNFSDGTKWEGQDDISEHISLFDEINNRISQIGSILDKHADPALAVPQGLLQEDEHGNSYFQVALFKTFEVMGKEDIIPQYVTWDGKLEHAYAELEKLIEFLMATAEVPNVALGMGESGTSGNSGLAIKWRMNNLLSKINRKRGFFEDALKQVFAIAQMLEAYANPREVDYEFFEVVIQFNDGLPKDETEIANRMAIRTNGSQTLSRKTALMVMDGLTEEQADAEIKRIDEEKEAAMVADPSIFNDPAELDVNKRDNKQDNANENSDKPEDKEETKE
ncbi:phage portal protein [Bacillus cereus group sp. BfR-BA-01313]|uniref:phage portal protein n=1 Tax=Bacillus cereus group sp. BfR-BA-01313 TaxID=2920290 RepID=UPI001F595722